jgi:hypothetical protein
MGRLIKRGGLGGVMVVCIAVLPGYAQAQTAAATGAAQTQSKIQVQTEEVIAPVTVLDKRGAPLLNLTQEDFRVFDNGVEQRIDHWDLGGDPVAVALVIETSSHVEMMAPVIHTMGSIFTETVMALNGEAALITYDSTVDMRRRSHTITTTCSRQSRK